MATSVMQLEEARMATLEDLRVDIIRSAARGQGPTFIAAKLDMLIAKATFADVLSANTNPAIDCPLCGVSVEQVASATLSLALWQHVNWVCAKARQRETEGK
jgi:hypothetical protein